VEPDDERGVDRKWYIVQFVDREQHSRVVIPGQLSNLDEEPGDVHREVPAISGTDNSIDVDAERGTVWEGE